MGVVLNGFSKWATEYLTGSERDEAHHHIVKTAEAFHGLTSAIADHEGVKF